MADQSTIEWTDATEAEAIRLFGQHYSGYNDRTWNEVSEGCRARFRQLAREPFKPVDAVRLGGLTRHLDGTTHDDMPGRNE